MVAGVIAAAAMTIAAPARAGFLDFLFGPQQEQPPSNMSSYAAPTPPVGRIAPPPMGGESVRTGASGVENRSGAFCVRLCDGQHFPVARVANATPVEVCRAMCPAAKTKVYFGGAIEHATTKEGARYADLDSAFVYQKHAVANCTCNGKDSFGLVPLDVASDPTLRPGDIVATKSGFSSFSGTRGQTNTFTPVASAPIVAELNHHAPAREQLAKRNETAPPEEDPGTIVQSQDSQQREPVAATSRGQLR
jgi:hypothetical protein